MGMTKFKSGRKHARVYHGRLKGNTENHIPNDEFREKYGEMKWQSTEEYKCPTCKHISHVHRLSLKIFTCPCGEGKTSEATK